MSAPESMPAEPPSAPTDGWQAAPPPPTHGIPGFVYADVPNRFIALIIDAFVMGVFLIVVGIGLGIVGIKVGVLTARTDIVGSVIYAAISLIVGAGYFIYSWTKIRASVGMRVLGMQVGNAFDGKTLSMEQASRRWIALWGPSIVSGALNGLSVIGNLVSFGVFLYLLYLLYTTAKSPTKQGFHDVYANTVVVKAARSV